MAKFFMRSCSLPTAVHSECVMVSLQHAKFDVLLNACASEVLLDKPFVRMTFCQALPVAACIALCLDTNWYQSLPVIFGKPID